MKKPKPPSIVSIAIMTTITVFVWIGYSVYKVLTTPPEINVPQEILAPLSPTLDTQTLAEISEKVYFEVGSTSPFQVAEGVEIEEEPTLEDEGSIELIEEQEEATESSSATGSAEL